MYVLIAIRIHVSDIIASSGYLALLLKTYLCYRLDTAIVEGFQYIEHHTRKI